MLYAKNKLFLSIHSNCKSLIFLKEVKKKNLLYILYICLRYQTEKSELPHDHRKIKRNLFKKLQKQTKGDVLTVMHK